MSMNLVGILRQLANLKQIDKDKLEEIIKEGIFQAVSKKLTSENELEIITDFKSNIVLAKFNRKVVEHDYALGEISLEDAKRINKNVEIGDFIPTQMAISEFEPKIIKNAKKAIMERIKKVEESRTFSKFESQKNQIISGRVRESLPNGYLIDIGFTDGLLTTNEQIEGEFFKVGDIVKAFVLDIRKRKGKVTVILSRTRPEFVGKIFELEIPEISSNQIEIKKIVREPGFRTKIAVKSKDPKIDAVASCLGAKGSRIKHIRKELNDEIIDVIKWDDAPEQLIANAIGVDLVDKVYLAERGKFARIIVSEQNKNQAIGRKGKNVKLAAKLTNYKLDIYTEKEFEEKIFEERRITSHVKYLDGVTEHTAEILKKYGYTSVQDIYQASYEELEQLEGLGKKTVERIKKSAKHF